MHLTGIHTRILPILATLACGTILQAQQSPPVRVDAELTSELAKLNRNVERIATLLERSLAGQRLELMMQRVGMGATRLSAAEQNLRSAKSTRNALFDEKVEIEARLSRIADDLDQGTLDMSVEELTQFTREMDLQLELLEERLRDADREISVLENEVMRQRSSIQDWQDLIDRQLGSQD